MNLRDTASKLRRLEQTRGFKLIGSGVITAIALVLIIGAVVQSNRPVSAEDFAAVEAAEETLAATETITNSDATQRLVSDLLGRAATPTGFIISVLAISALCLLIVWLGVGLTYLGILLVAAILVVPLALFKNTRPYATFTGAVSSLAIAFTVLMQALRLVLSGPGPVMAIARNVLAEAVRLKLSLVFIVLLVFGLSALPSLLDASQPLRYRVQSFLSWGTGGTFWLTALLVVAFSVSTVAGEQRDKVIWQTVTKPVAAWQYVLGKWVGVSSLAALLLAVNSAGVFLFVEYLRNQPAQGEREAFVAMQQSGISEDRVILESQVLTARRTVDVLEPDIDAELVDRIITEQIGEIRDRDPGFQITEEELADWREQYYKRGRLLYFAIPPGDNQTYVFENVDLPQDSDVPITLTWRIDAGANRPDEQYTVGIAIDGIIPVNRVSALGHSHSMPLSPAIVFPPQRGSPLGLVVTSDTPEEPGQPGYATLRKAMLEGTLQNATMLRSGDIVDDQGRIGITFHNGAIRQILDERQTRLEGLQIVPNADPIQFPAGSLKLSYPVGSYHLNFAKAVLVLWLKLVFLAMLGITAATFLSFSVASMVAFGVFMIAESSPFIKDALHTYATVDTDQNIQFFRVGISAIAHAVSWIFLSYGDLSPVSRLVAGENVSLLSIGRGLGVVVVWSGLLYGLAIYVFRRRELAIYSGS